MSAGETSTTRRAKSQSRRADAFSAKTESFTESVIRQR